MSERQDFIALDWVAGEIGETLDQAAQALEAYIANRDDSTKLRFCLTHIHQVHGTLQMVEFFGAALLAEEMEGVAEALTQNTIHGSHVDDALEVLRNAIAQLPVYLEKVKESRHGLPATLLPVLNDLRAVRGESLLSETVLFAPQMASAQANTAGDLQISSTELAEIAHKLRQMFQIALLGFIRGNDVKKNLNYLAKVCARLVKLTEGFPSQPLWKVCIAVLEGLLNGSIESSVAVKILLRQVDRQIKNIIDDGQVALDTASPDDLLKNLLYYVARSKASSRYIQEIKADYRLENSLLGETELDDDTLATPDAGIMQSVVEALSQEMKDIQLALAEAGNSAAALTDVLPLFRRVNDTMAILGMGSTLKQVQEPYTRLAKALATQDTVADDELHIISDQVAKAEAELNPSAVMGNEDEQELFNDSEEAQEHLDLAFESVVRESRNGLEQAKEAIIEFVATQWNHSCLSDLPALLNEIHGSLNMVPLTRAAQVIKSCENYVSESLLAEKAIPEWQVLDTLADAITSIDYYLERLTDDNGKEGEAILDVATESVAELGYPIAAAASESDSIPVLDNFEAEAQDEASEEQVFEAEQEEVSEPADIPVLAEVIPLHGATDESEPEPEDAVESLGDSIQATEEAEEDEDFDPEIVEIFIEEAGEVLETIDEFLPQWQADHNDEEARSTVRRAFHTLKGSGRMVGATDIGELAWSVENMLNRVMDGSINIDQVRFDLMIETRAKVPELVTAFEQRQNVDKALFEPIIERANALAAEQNPELDVAADSTSEPEAVVDGVENTVAEDVVEDVVAEELPGEDIPVLEEVEELSGLSEADTVIDIPTITDDDIEASDVSAEDEDLDEELLDIFAAEAAVHGQVLDDFIAHCKELAGPAELTDALQRALHTLKGSANMAGILPVVTVVTPVEHVVKELRASQLKVDAPWVDLLERGSLLMKAGIEQLSVTPLQELPGVEEYVEELMALFNERIASAADVDDSDSGIPPEALNQFLTESLDLITEISGRLVLWQQGDVQPGEPALLESLMDRFISHAESVNMLAPVEFGQQVQVLYRHAAEQDPSAVKDDFFELSNRANDSLIDMLDQIAGHQTPVFDIEIYSEVEDFEFASVEPEAPVIETVVDGALDAEPEVELDAASDFDEIMVDDDDLVEVLSEDSELLEDSEVVEIDLDATISMSVVDEELDEDSVEAQSNEEQAAVDDETIIAAMTGLAEAVAEIQEESEATEPEPEPEPEPESELILESISESIEEHEEEPVAEAAVEAVVEAAPEAMTEADDDDEIDDEIIEIFLEEADDLLEGLDEAIHGWIDDRGNRSYLDDLLRILHTLKGGARLAGMTPVGNLSHNFETSLIGLENQQEEVSDETLNDIQNYQDQLIAQISAVKAGEAIADVEQIDEPELDVPVATEPEAELIEADSPAEVEEANEISFDESFDMDDIDIEAESAEEFVVDESVEEETIATVDENVVEFDAEVEPEPAVESEQQSTNIIPISDQRPREVSAVEIATPLIDPNAKKGPQEVVKVSASLLEELVNLAGETSISRGRAEEQISELVFSLDEMQITVDRLQEQVRRLDMETEQQILYRQEQVESEGLEGFDPLEMDRYSQLQQLSRSLLESSSDLIDIKSTLADKSRDMETLLIQQSRINTELQEGLMRSQMVPFSRMVPRLRRIIRQISGELNKKVDFQLDNIEGELDRSVLERMVAPLEHMLRNAVDHGIESAAEREKSGKAARGNVTLGLAREGGEVVITLSDDGGGINLEAVKSKAIERGLMEADADLTDHEILQFILQAGFSTATEVTQISGRGVGMDVVHSEIKQLGGSMDIDSTQGQGTSFVVRLPFTVSVNRALMVRVGTDMYAIPLNSIEGIVRVSPFELEAYYQPDAPMFEYAGQPYLLRYMGALLHRGEKPNLEGQSMPLPVVLVRGAEHSVAIQVDNLMGSREIVVKPLGPQFSTVQGLSGATVLGDGSVVVILDLLAMIRADASHMYRDFIAGQEEQVDDDRNTIVMVVDDSVTVRKVTSRLLERQGMDVVLAKDGVDAVTQLQEIEIIPDVMLLDIEMPRMDGFEVASRVRHNSRLKDIPIIMITSRTGEKHRERALSLGVNEYLGKPYQESVLLETINALTGETAE